MYCKIILKAKKKRSFVMMMISSSNLKKKFVFVNNLHLIVDWLVHSMLSHFLL